MRCAMQDGCLLGHRRFMFIACFSVVLPLVLGEVAKASGGSCEELVMQPNSWKVFPRLGRTLRWTLPTDELHAVAEAFQVLNNKSDSGNPTSPVEKRQGEKLTEVFLRPGVDAILMPDNGKQCSEAISSGDMRLSTSPACTEETEKGANSDLVKFYRSESTIIARLALGKECPVMQQASSTPPHELNMDVCDIQYFFCVKPSGQTDFVPLHFFWYKRDADGKSARAFLDTSVKDMLKGWVFTNSIVMHRPLDTEWLYEDCLKSRATSYTAQEQSGTDDTYPKEKLRTNYLLPMLRDDCDTNRDLLNEIQIPVTPKHSAVLLCFRKGKNEGSEASALDEENSAVLGQVPALSTILVFMRLLVAH